MASILCGFMEKRVQTIKGYSRLATDEPYHFKPYRDVACIWQMVAAIADLTTLASTSSEYYARPPLTSKAVILLVLKYVTSWRYLCVGLIACRTQTSSV